MPALKITRDELAAFQPCSLDARLALFGRRKSLTAAQALEAGASIRDVLWVAGRMGRKDLCVRFALLAAQRAVRYDKSGTVQPCLDAAQAYVDEPSEANLGVLRDKRRAAAYAAAYAAYAAAYAADAAAYAADAAAYAAYAAAAAAAAYAADAAAYAAEREEQKKLLIEVMS